MTQSPVRILHVQDDALHASVIQSILTDDSGAERYELVQVGSLKKALRQLKEGKFSAALLDLALHDVSALDSLRVIKDEHPNLPVVVISSHDNEDMAMKALEEGAQDYVMKGHASPKVIRMAIKSSIKRKAMERDLYYKANYDDLTGLMNRRYFTSCLQRALARAKRWQHAETVLFIDLNRFKQINDTYGHAAGNALLHEVGRRMTDTLRATDIVARYGGDEFVVLLDDHNDDPERAAVQLVARIQDAFRAPLIWNGYSIDFSVSIGMAVYPEAGDTANALIESADKAMYEAKKQSRQRPHFEAWSAEI